MDGAAAEIFKFGADWKSRAIGFFHFLCFVVLLIALGMALGAAGYFAVHGHLPPFMGHGHGAKPPTPPQLGDRVLPEWLQAIAALLATWIMALATGQKFTRFGYGGQNRIRNFLIGLVAGVALLAVLLIVMQALGGADLGRPTFDPKTLALYAGKYGLLFLGVAVFEETSMRGYALVALSRAFSFWPAAILLALLFGAAHLGNGASEGYVGATTAGLFGVVIAYSFFKTGSLWFAVGFHAAWDYAESYIFGTSDSGLPALPGCLFHPTFHGPAWLTGGTVGPEGSVLVLVVLLAIFPIAWFIRTR